MAGLVAGLVVLASPSLGFWSGFSGPDPLAQALALTAALAFVHGRSRLGGVFLGLAVATRPEIPRSPSQPASSRCETRETGPRSDERRPQRF